jgi:hypothetical protein
MTWQQSLVLGLLAALVALLIQGKLRPALVFLGRRAHHLHLSGLMDINAVVAGYTNSALLTWCCCCWSGPVAEDPGHELVRQPGGHRLLQQGAGKVWFSISLPFGVRQQHRRGGLHAGGGQTQPNHAPSRLAAAHVASRRPLAAC